MNRTIPFLVRTDAGTWKTTRLLYSGVADPAVWNRVMISINREFVSLDATRFFFPCDSADAYHECLRKTENAACDLAAGAIALSRANPATYLSRVAHFAFLSFFRREVLPRRADYHALAARCRTAEESSAESLPDAPDSPDDPVPRVTAQTLAEQLPARTLSHARRLRAARELEDIYSTLCATAPRLVTFFRAYVLADGNIYAAARLCHMPPSLFYRHWPSYISHARKILTAGGRPRVTLRW